MTLNSTGNLVFPDNGKAIFGSGSDLEIYHDGANSYVKENGTGALVLQSNGTAIVLEQTNGENMILANTDGAVTVYYDGSAKLTTSSTGVDVTGNLLLDSDNTEINLNRLDLQCMLSIHSISLRCGVEQSGSSSGS